MYVCMYIYIYIHAYIHIYIYHNFLLQYLEISSYSILQGCSVMSNYLRPHGLYSPGQNTRVDNLSLLQGIFPTQGLNPGLLHCRWIIYQLSHKGSPYIYVFFSLTISSKFAYRIALLTSPCAFMIQFLNLICLADTPDSLRTWTPHHLPILPFFLTRVKGSATSWLLETEI